ncbi:MAG: GAF domain-containing protein [Deltaproteobacteria bacterium]|nr:GAF domain-containing protein [Deltaproteobacteria bacterium]MBW2072514.1 GAF domain-containing protein [Deltaproteobacteria bacterium]
MIHSLKEQIRKLNQIGIALSSETHLPSLLDLIVREVRNFTRADAGSLYIKAGNQLRFEVAQNDTLASRNNVLPEAFRPFPIPLDTSSIAGYVAINGTLLNIPDAYKLSGKEEYRFNPTFDERNNYRTRSMLTVPMRDHENEIIGVLQLINSLDSHGRVTVFEPEQEELVASLASQAAVAIRNAKLIRAIHDVFAALVRYSASAIDARSPHTAGHSRRVATYCLRLARAVNQESEGPLADVYFNKQEMEELHYAAWLHDIGKIGVREEVLERVDRLSPAALDLIVSRFEAIKLARIREVERQHHHELEQQAVRAEVDRVVAEVEEDLRFIRHINCCRSISPEQAARILAIGKKTYRDARGQQNPYLTEEEVHHLTVAEGNLTTEEYQEIQNHVLHTLNIINKIPFTRDLERIPLIAAAHHEKLDGSGYPLGLKAPDIMIQARILGLADMYDALTATDRPYRGAMRAEEAIKLLEEEAAKGKLDADLVDLFVRRKLYEGVS